MKKDGFIFMESLTVLIVVLLATTMLLSSYSLFVRKSKEKETYNFPSDRYLLFNIARLNAKDDEYYTNSGYIANRREASVTNPNSCENTPMKNRLSDCKQLFKDTDLVFFIVIKDIKKELKRPDITSVYDSGTIEYLKTLKKELSSSSHSIEASTGEGYIVGVFYKNGTYRYASIPLYDD